jgi:tripartite-type tricarboxylate transporter receptor subunit TctC
MTYIVLGVASVGYGVNVVPKRRAAIPLLRPAAALAGTIAAFWCGTHPAAAQGTAPDGADFYRGKQITLLIGLAAGTTYDVYARLLARHLPKHIPGEPVIIPSNKPGAGSLSAVNSLYNTAPRDGTVIGTGHRFVPLMPLLGLPGTQFDALKFNYIGSMARETGLCIARKDAGIRSMADTRTREFTVGTTGAGSELTTFTATMTRMLGAKFKVVSGYPSSGEIDLAIERGELEGRCGVSYGSLRTTRPDWLEKKQVEVLIQLGLSKEPELPDVPLLGDLVSNQDDRAALELMLAPANMARPFFAPPGVPPERVQILRKAFDAALKDPGLIEEAAKQRLELMPTAGAEMEALFTKLHSLPQPVLNRARALANTQE